ncbi:MAG TPA: hypothetical protein VFG09_00465 [Thermodesulfovibrionales bacterium]|nr:hypothetical protein [Thermodesulfovibrionales bacterium]
MPLLKDEIKDALKRKDFEGVIGLALKNKKVLSILISLAYDKEDVLCWRAIEAMGKAAGAVAEEDPSAVRNIVQRLIWSVREESGSIGWSAPEMLGEIVRNSPAAFADIPSIILSFHEEEMFLKGVLWAMGRLAEAGLVHHVTGAAELSMACLNHNDPQVRCLAAIAACHMKLGGAKDAISRMISDTERITIYEDHELRAETVGDIMKSVSAGFPCAH